MSDDAPFVTVKVVFPRGEPFESAARRLAESIEAGRHGPARAVDREVALVTSLPGIVVRFLVGLARWLDGLNLLPGVMIRDDPMYASLFLANLGSVGLADTYHHLYEYGTVSIFGAVSLARRTAFVEREAIVVKEGLQVRWTFDERINDAHYCAGSLRIAQDILEEPDRYLGPPEAATIPAPSLPA